MAITADTAEQRRTLKIALGLNAAMFAVEVTAGVIGHSMGLVAEGLDNLTDAAAYGIAMLANHGPQAPPAGSLDEISTCTRSALPGEKAAHRRRPPRPLRPGPKLSGGAHVVVMDVGMDHHLAVMVDQ